MQIVLRLALPVSVIVALGLASAACTKQSDSGAEGTASVNTQINTQPAAAREASPSVKIWKTLSLVEQNTKTIPADVKALLGQKVKVAGFAIVNELEAPDKLAEFLLTPISGGCVHVPPPPPNYVVHVRMKDGKTAEMSMGPLEVEGVLSLPKKEKDREFYSFELVADAVEKFKPQPRATPAAANE